MLDTYNSFPVISLSDQYYAIIINWRQYYFTKILTKQNSIIVTKQFIDNLESKPQQDKRTYIQNESPTGSIEIEPSLFPQFKSKFGFGSRWVGRYNQSGSFDAEDLTLINWSII